MEKETWEKIVGKVKAVKSLTLGRCEEEQNERVCSVTVKGTGIN
jgi:hypothetical protein